MAKKSFLMGMLAVGLIFGMTVLGCKQDPDPTGGTVTVKNSGTETHSFVVFDETVYNQLDAWNTEGGDHLTDIQALVSPFKKEIVSGATANWSFDKDGKYYAYCLTDQYGTPNRSTVKPIDVSGGDTKTVEFSATDLAGEE